MTVKQIEKIQNGRGRVRLTLADASVFVLYPADFKELGMAPPAEGEELPEENIRRIREELLPLRAKKRAMHLLEKRPYTERRLREKLAEGEYPEEAAEAAIAYVRSYGYLDDRRYAEDYISYRLETQTRAKLTAALLQRGVDRHVIEEAYAAACETAEQERSFRQPTDGDSGTNPAAEGRTSGDFARDTERTLLQKELRKKRVVPETLTFEEKQRLMASLVRKGFEPVLVREMLRT